MRNIPGADLAKLFAAQSGDWIAWNFIEIAHPDMAEPLRFVNSGGNKVHQSHTYEGRQFEFAFPTQSKETLGDGALTIDDTDLALTEFYFNYARTKRATLTLFLVANSDMDSKLVKNYRYLIKSMTFDKDLCHVTLTHSDTTKEQYPFMKFDRHFPALHGVESNG